MKYIFQLYLIEAFFCHLDREGAVTVFIDNRRWAREASVDETKSEFYPFLLLPPKDRRPYLELEENENSVRVESNIDEFEPLARY